jgi:hypothetical protein
MRCNLKNRFLITEMLLVQQRVGMACKICSSICMALAVLEDFADIVRLNYSMTRILRSYIHSLLPNMLQCSHQTSMTPANMYKAKNEAPSISPGKGLLLHDQLPFHPPRKLDARGIDKAPEHISSPDD